MLRVVNTSALTGKQNQMLLPVTQEQIKRWQDGDLVQDVFPFLNDDQREFLMTGITPDEWEAALGTDDDDD